MKRALVSTALALASLPLLAADPPLRTADAAAIVLDVPIRCRIGVDCVIQQYPDHAAGQGAADYRCGPMSYAGHDGTDFRVKTQRDQRRGVDVIAAAAGTVRGVRDGMEDRDVRLLGRASVQGRECGNGVVIAHHDGWETQYCHLAQGSIRVRAGENVTPGTVLGHVGESGDAAFPHVHLAVRHEGEKIDPFSGEGLAAACGAGRSLWSPSAAAALAYRSPDLLDAGFATRAITMAEVQEGLGESAPTASSPALVAYARVIGLRAGDRPSLTLLSPAGATLAASALPAMVHDRAEQLLFVGKRNGGAGWTSGRYLARVEVQRDGITVLTRDFSTRIAASGDQPSVNREKAHGS